MNNLLLRRRAMGVEPGYWETIIGVSPLLLSSALRSNIKSLIQTGLCTQSSTPTPSSPVDIMCNNGALRMVDDELPIGYKRLTGIRFDGDTWYETGEALSGEDDVTMTLDNTASQGQNVFGSYNGTSSGAKNLSLFIYGNGSTSNSYFRYGEQLLRPRFGTGERTITFGKSGTDGFAIDVSATSDTFTTPANTYIGMLPNSTSPAYTGDILGNILVSTRLKWVPCERASDGVIGYYEAVNGNFIAPSGTGTPASLGYDGSHYSQSVVGTPEVLSVTATGAVTQTASVVNLFAVDNYKDEVEIINGGVKRKVGITILTGEETGWALSDSGTIHRFRCTKPSDCHTPASRAPIMSSHFVYNATGQGLGGAFIGASTYWYWIPTDQTIDTVEKWIAWLKEQYAQGTPVFVLYPLKEETTESVTPQTLSTSNGDNIVTVNANVSPVNLSVTFKKVA